MKYILMTDIFLDVPVKTRGRWDERTGCKLFQKTHFFINLGYILPFENQRKRFYYAWRSWRVSVNCKLKINYK